MKLTLWCALYSAVLCLAAGLECYYYKGPVDRVHEKQKSKQCESDYQSCRSSILKISGIVNINVLVKGCSKNVADTCNKTHTSTVKGIQTSEAVRCCESDLCNKDLLPVSDKESQTWGTECLACNGLPSACGGSDLPILRCDSAESQCLEASILTAFGLETHQTLLKGCSNSSICPGLAAFSNGQSPVSYSSSFQCCNKSHCNSGHIADSDPGAENGLECYSRSSSSNVSKMKCRGEMTQCVDLIGSSTHDVVMSGCATPGFCQGLYPKFNVPGWSNTTCCTASLCNHGNNSTSPAS